MSRGSWVAGLVLIHSGEEMCRGRRHARSTAVARTNASMRRSDRSERVAQCRANSCLHSKHLISCICSVIYKTIKPVAVMGLSVGGGSGRSWFWVGAFNRNNYGSPTINYTWKSLVLVLRVKFVEKVYKTCILKSL